MWSDMGENDKAIADFTAAIRQNPKDAEFYNNRGIVWKRKGEFDIAIADYDEAIKLNPQYWEAHNNRASAWHSKREQSKAIADFNEAIRLNPRNAIIYKNRSQLWQEIGDYDRAISDLTAAIRLDPQYAEAYKKRGFALETRGSLQKALTDFKTYTELTPSSADGKRAIARVEAKLSSKPDQLQKRAPDVLQIGVPVKKFGGTFTVPVHINGVITLDFMIDSGASDVSIPADVVSTLIRTGSIKTSDFTGEQIYRLADGSTVPSATFVIRSLKVGDRSLENVTASVAAIEGSLLLGQSFLNRFRSWSIDNERQMLILN